MGHAVQDPVPPPLYRPRGHWAHGTAPPGVNCPAPHTPHVVRPDWSLYCPAGHAAQLDALTVVVMEPAAQGEHGNEPPEEYDPGRQPMHDVAPVTLLN